MVTEKYRKFQVPTFIGMKVFKGTVYGPAEYLSEGQQRSRMMNQEETAKYFSKVTRSKGFDVDGCTGCMPGRIAPVHPDTPDFELAKILTRWAAATKFGTRLSYLALVKANIQPVAGIMLYITFSAIDTVDDLKKYYRAQVFMEPRDPPLIELEYFKEVTPKKAGNGRKKARTTMSLSRISRVRKRACVLPSFTAFLLKIKSDNPAMTHEMARTDASKKWKMMSNDEKKAFISQSGLKTKV